MENKKHDWDFTHEEQVPDWGVNVCGIIRDSITDEYLFFHILKNNEDDKIETCYIYDSMYMSEPIARYAWTASNDSLLLVYLNRELPLDRLNYFPFDDEDIDLSSTEFNKKFDEFIKLFA